MPATAPVRLAKPHLEPVPCRAPKTDARGLDTSGLTHVIAVDPEARTADVAGMCTYEDLVAATLPHGLAPLVVPQLKTITLGGAVTGLGIESTSFRNGLPHESVLEMDILTGAGEVLTASPCEHADLFRAFPNSYGTLGYAVRLRIELEPVRAVRRAHAPAVPRARRPRRRDGPHRRDRQPRRGSRRLPRRGRVQRRRELPLRRQADRGIRTPSATTPRQQIFYRSIQHDEGATDDRLTVHDYLWRWDTDWFWCSGAFGAQHPLVRRALAATVPAQQLVLEADAASNGGSTSATASRSSSGRPPRERVIQDIEVPIERCAEFLDWFLAERADRADLAVPAAPARRRRLAAVPAPAAAHVRQRRLLVDRAGRSDRGGDQPADRTEGQPSSTATSRCTPTPTTPARSSTSSTAARHIRPRSSGTTPIHDSSTSMRRRCNDDDLDQGRRGEDGGGPEKAHGRTPRMLRRAPAARPGREAHPRRDPRDASPADGSRCDSPRTTAARPDRPTRRSESS